MLESLEKAEFSMEVTELGIVTLVNEVQPEKTYPSMAVMESGIVMLVSEEQSLKA